MQVARGPSEAMGIDSAKGRRREVAEVKTSIPCIFVYFQCSSPHLRGIVILLLLCWTADDGRMARAEVLKMASPQIPNVWRKLFALIFTVGGLIGGFFKFSIIVAFWIEISQYCLQPNK